MLLIILSNYRISLQSVSCLAVCAYAGFPALLFRSSVKLGSSSIFIVSVAARPGAPPTRKRG